MGMFLLIYYLSLSEMVSPYIQAKALVDFLLYAYLVLILITLTIVHLEIYRKLKSHAVVVGLGNKLDLYYSVVRMRMRTFLVVSLFLAAGFFFTGHPWFSIYFGGMIGWFLLQWPTPLKVSNQLKLRGDERTMVMTKGEAFKF
jgi:magnesium-transporting ATPase (P-type)